MNLSLLEDADRYFYPWNYINAMMVDDFRTEVMRTAWKHRPKATLTLRKSSTQAFLGAIHVKGFRSSSKRILRLAYTTVRDGLAHSMMMDADVAAAVVALWAEARRDVISALQQEAVGAGFTMRDQWNPQMAQQGFYSIVMIGDFYDFALNLTEETPEQWRNCLAALWLSSAFINSEYAPEPEPEAEPFDAPPESVVSPEVEVIPEPQPVQVIITDEREPELEEEASSEDDTEDDDIPALADLNLSLIDDSLAERLQQVQREHQRAISIVQELAKDIKHGNSHAALERAASMQTHLVQWEEAQTRLHSLEIQVVTFLHDELRERSDLVTPVALDDLDIVSLSAGDIEALAKDLISTVEAIAAYDTQKDRILSSCQQLVDDITNLAQSLDNPQARLADLLLGDDDPTLQVVRQWESKLRSRKKHLEDEIQSLRETLIDQINQQIDKLRERGIDPAQVNLGDNPNLSFKDIERRALPVLRTLRFILQTRMDDWIQQHTQDDRETAENVRVNYNAETLSALLEHLAAQERDVEALLILLCTYAVQDTHFELTLSDAVVNSVLYGIQTLSDDSHGFSLLNRLAPTLLNKWECEGSFGQARLSLMLIGAAYEHQQMPEGTLWQANIQQWAYPEMPEWARLWNAVLFSDEKLVFVDGGDYQVTIDKARQAAEEALKKENGRFIRPSSIDSTRHSAMLAGDLLPGLVEMQEQLQTIEGFMATLPTEQVLDRASGWLTRLEMIQRTLVPERMEEHYDHAMRVNGVRDKAPFHRNKTLKVYFDSAETVVDYATALTEALNARTASNQSFDKWRLLLELEDFPELRQLAASVLERVANAPTTHPERDRTANDWQAQQGIIEALLTRATYAARLPHLIRLLVNRDVDYDQWADALLTDLVETPTPEQVAQFLLEAEASNQVLLLNHVPVALHSQAQELQARQRRVIDEMEDRVQQIDGRIDDLQTMRRAGRWGLLHTVLTQRIQEQEEFKRLETEDMQNRVGVIFQRQSQVGMKLLMDAAIPQDVRQLVQEGLNLIQQSLAEGHLFPGMISYLEDMEYRLEHQSWSLSSLQDSLRKLKTDARGLTLMERQELTAERVLSLLERNELLSLGLSDEQMVFSKIETRTEVLRHWLAVRAMDTFHIGKMTPEERQHVELLFRHFTQMTTMYQVKSPAGEHIRDNSLTLTGLYILRYPKTDVLDTTCAFITLPGERPKPSHLRELHAFIDDKQWLPDYFVFLFVPGCTPELRERLEQEYRRQGLVVIDEARLLEMVLAETSSTNPIGRLRSLMLNTRHLAEIDIFKTNQLVDPVRSIFEGREDVIRKIVTSGENYAIYGGRRIGKSSLLRALQQRLERRDYTVIMFSFEGMRDCSDRGSAMRLGFELGFTAISDIEDLYQALRQRMDDNPHLKLAFVLDEVDRYIEANRQRHLLIETFRNLSAMYGNRFRIVVAGFMSLYNCLNQRYPNPYSSNSDPWVRTFEKEVIGNLTAEDAERIAREGFLSILGWRFKTRSIPQDIVKRTGGHPAFVQKFCEKLQRRVAQRGDQTIIAEDLEEIFNDPDPERSFIAYVRETLSMNLDPVGEYVILWLADEVGNARNFRLEQAEFYANLVKVPPDILRRSLDTLKSTSVITTLTPELYEFAVPDYPLILKRMGDTSHLESLEKKVQQYLARLENEGRNHA